MDENGILPTCWPMGSGPRRAGISHVPALCGILIESEPVRERSSDHPAVSAVPSSNAFDSDAILPHRITFDYRLRHHYHVPPVYHEAPDHPDSE